MPLPASVSFRDRSNEPTSFNPNLDDTLTTAAAFTALGNIITPAFADGLILGLPLNYSIAYKQASGIVGPQPANAHREVKWIVSYQDTSQFLDPPTNSVPNPYYLRIFSQELPCANPDILPAGSDTLPLTSTEAVNFVSAFNTNAKSPVGGNVNIIEIRWVGRNI